MAGSGTIYYLYTDIPGAGKGWTLAVLAVNQADADHYMGGKGRRIATIPPVPGTIVRADCGAVTDKARALIRNNLEIESSSEK